MSESSTTRLSLLIRLRDTHDRLAWEQFVGLYAPLVYGFARRNGLQDADAADVAQDVLMSVAQQIRQWEYQPDRGSFRGWLFTIARNRLRNWRSSAARRQDGRGGDDHQASLNAQPQNEPDEAAWDAEYGRQVFHWAAGIVRQQVSDQTWQAFERTAVEGRTGPEVATELGMTVGAVYLARSRVMARLKQHVQVIDD
jgi:RNA polymerase sigma-70 factor (ECF subfamily)